MSQAFWHACAAGQRRAAEYLLSRGADLNWEPDYAHGTPLDSVGYRNGSTGAGYLDRPAAARLSAWLM